jgi:hypothetical protein
MRKQRRIILGLVALGRITPTEAERLLVASNAGREGLWIVIALAALSMLTQFDPRQVMLHLPHLAHAAHALLPELTLHHALALHLIGGMR